jgi:hypothetical protein
MVSSSSSGAGIRRGGVLYDVGNNRNAAMVKAITGFLSTVEQDAAAHKGCGACNPSRRLVLLAAPLAIALPIALARGAEKMSKQAAQYEDAPHGIAMCATCSLFVEPRACKVVEGDISPNGWCKAYAMAD